MKDNENVADEVLLDDELIEKGFNDALEDLQKSLGLESDANLQKAKKGKTDEDEEEEAEEEDEMDEEEDDDEEYRKSIPDLLADDPEAAAAMDVEPFLFQLAKAIDESIEQIQKSVGKRIGKTEAMIKSQAKVIAASAQLQKSTREMVKSMGEQPVGSRSIKRLQKSRFEGSDGAVDVDNNTVLAKSREWLRNGKMDLMEANMIEGRINKGLLFKSNDPLDRKVADLMKKEGE